MKKMNKKRPTEENQLESPKKKFKFRKSQLNLNIGAVAEVSNSRSEIAEMDEDEEDCYDENDDSDWKKQQKRQRIPPIFLYTTAERGPLTTILKGLCDKPFVAKNEVEAIKLQCQDINDYRRVTSYKKKKYNSIHITLKNSKR